MGKKQKYTEEQVEFVKKLVDQGSNVTPAARKMCEHFGLQFDDDTYGRGMRKKMQKMGVTNNVPTIEDTDDFKEAQKKQHDNSKKRFIVSWGQSDTPVHKPFLKNIEAYAKEIDADILIVAGRYKNPTSLASSKALEKAEKSTNTWDKSILPYLDANRHNLHEHLVVLSDVKVQPTATMPLTSMNSLTGLESCIIGSPRVHMKFLPVLDGYPTKMLTTTGAITLPNYTDTKIGKQSEFNHTFAFVVVELDGDIFHIRNVIADKKGNFYDLCYKVEKGEVLPNDKIEVAVLGDIHLTAEDAENVDVTFSMLERFNPNHVILHDIADMSSISHHEKRNPFQLLRREEDGSNSLERELNYIRQWFRDKPKYNYVVPNANHNDFIDRWLQNEDWRKEGNKKLYLKYANVTAEGLAPKGIIAYILENEFDHIKCLAVDDSYSVLNIEFSLHGDRGSSGSRGSIGQFKNLNVRTVTAHSHSSSRTDGHLCVGTLTKLRMGYNLGMSQWNSSNVVVYPNGKAQHVHITRGGYTTFF